ncbi:MAG TPA: efflux RND transporter periplasmic adaptor subunit, partial [Gammaproteobacteria bacterium]|nr:efflux RND transporter periplasmic adaptor subunit [Gammaproteobacteria bacterium]
MKWNNKSYALLILGLGTLFVAILIWTRPQKQPQLLTLPAARVYVALLSPALWQPRVQRIGRFEPRRRSQLHFEVSGVITGLPLKAGKRVKAGDVLMILDNADYRDSVREASSNLKLEQASIGRDQNLLRLANDNRALQQGEVARLEKLNKKSLVSRTALDAARQRKIQLSADWERLQYSMDSADARLMLKQVALDRAQRNLDRTQLRAPYNGVVNRIDVELGDRVGTNTDVVEVVDLDELELYVQVRSETAASLEVGQQVEIQVQQGKPTTGLIVSIQRDPDAGMTTHAVRIRVSAKLAMSGQLATVKFSLPESQDALLVPASAVLHDQGS